MIELELHRKWRVGQCSGADEMYRALESVVQSLNNLEEKFHQSSSFYMILGTERFVPFSVFVLGFFIAPLMFFCALAKQRKGAKKYDAQSSLFVSYFRLMQVPKHLVYAELLSRGMQGALFALAHITELIIYLGFHDGAPSYLLSLAAMASTMWIQKRNLLK